MGLPVFANGGGLSYILQPSFGFLLSFPITVCFLALLKAKLHLHSFIQRFPLCMFALCTIYSIGWLVVYVWNHELRCPPT